jgi:hypothetical protein
MSESMRFGPFGWDVGGARDSSPKFWDSVSDESVWELLLG